MSSDPFETSSQISGSGVPTLAPDGFEFNGVARLSPNRSGPRRARRARGLPSFQRRNKGYTRVASAASLDPWRSPVRGRRTECTTLEWGDQQ